MSDKLLEVENLKKHYPIKSLFSETKWVRALDGVSFFLKKKKTLAVVGESGCGKSTLAKALMKIEVPTGGDFKLDGKSFLEISDKEFRQKIQMIFQDPYSSINPRKKAWQIISEPLKVNKKLSNKECRDFAHHMMEKVGLRPEYGDRFPHMFSGGQRQRIGVARALSLQPSIIICDEPVSALDVSVQAQVLNLLMDLQQQFELSYIFISHDLSVVELLADSVMVMYLGEVVEYGNKRQIFSNPKHPYTQALIASTPRVRAENFKSERRLVGELPSPIHPPPGCKFHQRCPVATEICKKKVPENRVVAGRQVHCHHAK